MFHASAGPLSCCLNRSIRGSCGLILEGKVNAPYTSTKREGFPKAGRILLEAGWEGLRAAGEGNSCGLKDQPFLHLHGLRGYRQR